MKIRGYRATDCALLAGHWLPGELLAAWLVHPPVLAEPLTIPLPAGGGARLYVVAGVACVRFAGLDWVARRARLQIGLAAGTQQHAQPVLELAIGVGFRVLDLHRLEGLLTPQISGLSDAVAAAGFVREATVPRALWHDGAVLDREIWGLVNHG